MNEFDKNVLMHLRDINISLKHIADTLMYLSRDTSITEENKDIGIAVILNDIKNQLIKKGK